MSVEPREVVRSVHAAYRDLVENDFALFEVDANERSLTHKLAEHLQRQFPDWHVDCEYNRKGELPKRLKVTTVRTNNTDGGTVFPDIIIHHRKTNENLVVIEAKKNSTVGTGDVEEKLRTYISDHGYRFAFVVVFPVGDKASEANEKKDVREVVDE